MMGDNHSPFWAFRTIFLAFWSRIIDKRYRQTKTPKYLSIANKTAKEKTRRIYANSTGF